MGQVVEVADFLDWEMVVGSTVDVQTEKDETFEDSSFSLYTTSVFMPGPATSSQYNTSSVYSFFLKVTEVSLGGVGLRYSHRVPC